MRKLNFKLWIFIIISSLLLSISIISIINVIFWKNDSNKSKQNVEEINKIVDIEQKEDTEETELVNKPLDNNSDYWYYTTFPLIDVDLNELKKK